MEPTKAMPTFEKVDQYFMRLALEQAKQAEQQGEVPVGAIAVIPKSPLIATEQITPNDYLIIGRGANQVIQAQDPSAHAEVVAMREAAHYLKNYRLGQVTLYVTLEPCAMCAGMMVHSRIQRLVYGATDPKSGAAGSVLNVLQHTQLNHQVQVVTGILANQSSQLLKAFFKSRRLAHRLSQLNKSENQPLSK